MVLTNRWKSHTRGERVQTMKKLAKRKAKGMTKAQRIAHAKMMAAARGSWERGDDGRMVFVRKIKQIKNVVDTVKGYE